MDCRKKRLHTSIQYIDLHFCQVKLPFLPFHRLMIFIFNRQITCSHRVGQFSLGRNNKVETINLITHVQGQSIRAKYVSDTGSLVTESQ